MRVNQKFLGILGGMGPLATADFLKKLVENTPSKTDQDHIPVILYGDCTIPDRTLSIEGVGPSPLPQLLRGIKHLVDSGVEVICIPCNSAHYWFEDLQAASAIPIIHLVDASIAQLKSRNATARKVGVLSTFGTYRGRVYASSLERAGYTVIEPSVSEFENLLTPGIALIKSNELKAAEELFIEASKNLLERGAEVIILGCTEIPIGLSSQCRSRSDIYVDSTDALVKCAIDFIKKDRRS